MTVRLTRTAHGHGPQSSGLDVADDGTVTAWQDYGHRVGRFARDLAAGERAALERALAAAAAAGEPAAPGGPLRPGGATERLTADGLPDVVLTPHAEPPAGFGDLVDLLRTIREDVAGSPVAAIELEVTGTPLAARLRHVGSESIALRMGTLTLQATLFGPDSALLDSAAVTVDASGWTGRADPGWSLPLADDLGLAAPRGGGFLTVTVGTPDVDVRGDGVLHPAELSWMAE